MKRTFLFLTLLVAAITVWADALDEALSKLPGVVSVKTLESADGVSKRVLMFEQPLDAVDADAGTFQQRLVIRHRGFDRPTVIVTEGYNNEYALNPHYTEELSELLGANTIMVEHRFNGASSPVDQRDVPADERYSTMLWQYLTVENSAYDYHHIRTTFAALYPAKWFSTGISKGGQTALFYRTYFPDDVVANVSYVAPLNKALEDGRHEPFIAADGTPEVRDRILAYQRAVLGHRAELLPALQLYADQKGYTFRVPLDEIFDLMVLEYPFAFWQWGDDPASVPAADAPTEDLYRSLIEKSEPSYFAEQTPYVPFNVQAMREIGYYGYDVRPFEGLLCRPTYEGYMRRVMIPADLRYLEFRGDLYERCCTFLREHDIPAMFIYGEYDPWSATRVVLPGEKQHMHVFIQPGGSHRTRVATMPDAMRQQILDILHTWAE